MKLRVGEAEVDTFKWDLIIIGGGPAGATAAVYAARACLKVLILEKAFIGGKLNKTLFIDNYPGYLERDGIKLGENIFTQLKALEVRLENEEVSKLSQTENFWVVTTRSQREFRTSTVLITTGLREKKLGIENEEEYYSKGVSYCAICEGNLYAGEEVIVIGGGNSALEESVYLSPIVSQLKLVHRRREFRGDELILRELEKKENVSIFTPYRPVKILVDSDRVRGLEIEHVESGEKVELSGKAVFIFIGLLPESEFLENLDIERDKLGFVCVDEEMRTNLKGLFAAGDVIHKELRQIVTAMSDGAIAAISVKNYLKELKTAELKNNSQVE